MSDVSTQSLNKVAEYILLMEAPNLNSQLYYLCLINLILVAYSYSLSLQPRWSLLLHPFFPSFLAVPLFILAAGRRSFLLLTSVAVLIVVASLDSFILYLISSIDNMHVFGIPTFFDFANLFTIIAIGACYVPAESSSFTNPIPKEFALLQTASSPDLPSSPTSDYK